MQLDQVSEQAKHIADAAAAVVAIGTLAQILPAVAAIFTILWLAIRIWESDTIRAITRRALTGKRDED